MAQDEVDIRVFVSPTARGPRGHQRPLNLRSSVTRLRSPKPRRTGKGGMVTTMLLAIGGEGPPPG